MSVDLTPLNSSRRLLVEAALQPIQGTRFQPTGFPDLGPATFQAGGTACVLVESAQSMANRLENTVWDAATEAPDPSVEGISYVAVNDSNGSFLTSSITEAHRINSPYILENKDQTFLNEFKEQLQVEDSGPVDRKAFANALFRYDVNSLLHGVFLAKKDLAGGRLRMSRAISAFVEAQQVEVAASGGVKNDHVDPSGDTAKGFGNVPFSREEFTSEEITAYFNIDLQQIRGYGLTDEQTRLLVLLALYKVRSLLDGDLRFRTACDLELKDDGLTVKRPAGFVLPSLDDIAADLKQAISDCQDQMVVSTVSFKK